MQVSPRCGDASVRGDLRLPPWRWKMQVAPPWGRARPGVTFVCGLRDPEGRSRGPRAAPTVATSCRDGARPRDPAGTGGMVVRPRGRVRLTADLPRHGARAAGAGRQ